MAMDLAAWLMEQPGVKHPSSAARTLAWAATSGERGVVGASSLGVVAQNVPNGTVQVRPGPAVIPSNYAGTSYESYILRNRTPTNLTINPTGSGGGRSDAVIARVDDTGLQGQPPADLDTYAFAKVQVIQGVSASLTDSDSLNLAYPSILLARIDIPASTGTITKAMIKDMRHIALAREEWFIDPHPAVSSDPATDLRLTSTSAYPDGEWFPNIGGPTNNGVFYIDIPKWATRMQIRAEWISVQTPPKSWYGHLWVAWGPGAQSGSPQYYTQAFQWDADEGASTYRQNLLVHDEVSVPAALRGSRQPLTFRGRRVDKSGYTGRLALTATSGIVLQVRFLERPDTDLVAD
jgi:hypothetical protein